MKIRKQPSKKLAAMPEDVAAFVQSALTNDLLSVLQVPCSNLNAFGNAIWTFSRSDMFHWVPLLDLFDSTMGSIIGRHWDVQTRLQKEPFDENTSRLLVCMLSFVRLLLENCSSRNIFASYDRLKRLLVTDDVMVLEAVLELLLIPGRKLDSQASLCSTFDREIGTDELAVLSQLALPFIPEMGEAEEARFALRFREHHASRLAMINSSASQEAASGSAGGSSMLTAPGLVGWSFSSRRDANGVDASSSAALRLQHIKMLATAIFLMAQPEGNLDSAFFAMSPTLIADTARILGDSFDFIKGRNSQSTSGKASPRMVADTDGANVLLEAQLMKIKVAAISILRACLKATSRWNEITHVLALGAPHGPVTVIFRSIVDAMEVEGDLPYSVPFMFAFMDFVCHMALHVEMDDSFVNAGLISECIRALEHLHSAYYKTVEKTFYVLDAMVHHYSTALDVFFSRDGLGILVRQAVRLVDQVVQSCMNDEGEESVKSWMQLLQCVLRFLDKLLSAHGSDDRLRVLLEGPLFRKFIPLFEESSPFNSDCVAHAIGIVSSFIHNEPTSLSVLQEQMVTAAMVQCMHRGLAFTSTSSVTGDVLGKIPYAFSAVCLNSVGCEEFERADPVKTFCALFVDPDMMKPLRSRSTATNLGAAMDEFIRHHPLFRGMVIRDVIDVLRSIPDVLQGLYDGGSGAVYTSPLVVLETSVAFDNVTLIDRRVGQDGAVDRSTFELEGEDSKQLFMPRDRKRVEPLSSQMLEIMCSFIEGMVATPAHAKEFIEAGGVEAIVSVILKAGIPYDFSLYNESMSVSHLLRMLGESDTRMVVSNVVQALKGQDMTAMMMLGGFSFANDAIVKNPGRQVSIEANRLHRQYSAFLALISLLKDMYVTHSYAFLRVGASLIQVFEENSEQLEGIATEAEGSQFHFATFMSDCPLMHVDAVIAALILRARGEFKATSLASFMAMFVKCSEQRKVLAEKTDDELKAVVAACSEEQIVAIGGTYAIRNLLSYLFLLHRVYFVGSSVVAGVVRLMEVCQMNPALDAELLAVDNITEVLLNSMESLLRYWGDYNSEQIPLASAFKALDSFSFVDSLLFDDGSAPMPTAISGASILATSNQQQQQQRISIVSEGWNLFAGSFKGFSELFALSQQVLSAVKREYERSGSLRLIEIQMMEQMFALFAKISLPTLKNWTRVHVNLRYEYYEWITVMCEDFLREPAEFQKACGQTAVGFVLQTVVHLVLCTDNVKMDTTVERPTDFPYMEDYVMEHFDRIVSNILQCSLDLSSGIAYLMRALLHLDLPVSTTASVTASNTTIRQDRVGSVLGWLLASDCPLPSVIRLRLLVAAVHSKACRFVISQLVQALPVLMESCLNMVKNGPLNAADSDELAAALLLIAQVVYYVSVPIKPVADHTAAVPLTLDGVVSMDAVTRFFGECLVDGVLSVGNGSSDAGGWSVDVVYSALFAICALTRMSLKVVLEHVADLVPILIKASLKCLQSSDRRHRGIAALVSLTLRHFVESGGDILSKLMEYLVVQGNPSVLSSHPEAFVNAGVNQYSLLRSHEDFENAIAKYFVLNPNDGLEFDENLPLSDWRICTKEQSYRKLALSADSAKVDLGEFDATVPVLPLVSDLQSLDSCPFALPVIQSLMMQMLSDPVALQWPAKDSAESNEAAENDEQMMMGHFTRCSILSNLVGLVQSYPACQRALLKSDNLKDFLRHLLDNVTPCGDLAGTLGSRVFLNEPILVSQLLDELCIAVMLDDSDVAADDINDESSNLKTIVVDGVADAVDRFVQSLSRTSPSIPLRISTYEQMSRAWCLVMTIYVLISSKSNSLVNGSRIIGTGTAQQSARLFQGMQLMIVGRLMERGVIGHLSSMLRMIDSKAPMAPMVAGKIVCALEMIAQISTKNRVKSRAMLHHHHHRIERMDDMEIDSDDSDSMDVDSEDSDDLMQVDDDMVVVEEEDEDDLGDISSASEMEVDDDSEEMLDSDEEAFYNFIEDMTDDDDDDEDDDDDDDSDEYTDEDSEAYHIIVRPPVAAAGDGGGGGADGIEIVVEEVMGAGDEVSPHNAAFDPTQHRTATFHVGSGPTAFLHAAGADDAMMVGRNPADLEEEDSDDTDEMMSEDDDDFEDDDVGFSVEDEDDEDLLLDGHHGFPIAAMHPNRHHHRAFMGGNAAAMGANFAPIGRQHNPPFNMVTRDVDVYLHPILGNGSATASAVVASGKQWSENGSVFYISGLSYTNGRWEQEGRMFASENVVYIASGFEQRLVDLLIGEARERSLLMKKISEARAELVREAHAAEQEQLRQLKAQHEAEAVAANEQASSESAPVFMDTGCDRDFLVALPFEMRQEVLEQYFEERRQRIPDGARVTISEEFLSSLPTELADQYRELSALEEERYRRRYNNFGLFRWVSSNGDDDNEDEASDDGEASVGDGQGQFVVGGDVFGIDETEVPPNDLEGLMRYVQRQIARFPELRRQQEERHHRAVLAAEAEEKAKQAMMPKTSPMQFFATAFDIGTLCSILRVYYDPLMTESRIHMRLFQHICSVPSSRTHLLNMLVYVLQEMPDDVMQLELVLQMFTARSSGASATSAAASSSNQSSTMQGMQLMLANGKRSLSVSGTPRKRPCTPLLMRPNSPQVRSTDPLGGSAYVVIQQRTLQLLMALVQHNQDVKSYFIKACDNSHWTIKLLADRRSNNSAAAGGSSGGGNSQSQSGNNNKPTVITTKYPIVLLLACLQKSYFWHTPLLVEHLMHLLQLVTVNQQEFMVKESVEIPEKFLSALVKTAVYSDLGPKALQYATSVLSSLAKLQHSTGSKEQGAVCSSPLVMDLADYATQFAGRTRQEVEVVMAAMAIVDENGGSSQQVVGELLSPSSSGNGNSVNNQLKEMSQWNSGQARLERCMRYLQSIVLKAVPFTFGVSERTSAPLDELNVAVDSVKLVESLQLESWTLLWNTLDRILNVITRSDQSEDHWLHIGTALLPALEACFLRVRHLLCLLSVGDGGAMDDGAKLSDEALRLQDVVFGFSEAHRTVINSMIRSNPGLLASGAFAMLIRVPRVLDFDNKRVWFKQQIHKKANVPAHRQTLAVHVRRAHVFEDSFHAIMSRSGEEVRNARLSIKFHDEEGMDAGGVAREWFAVLSRQMFDPNYALFCTSAVDKITYQPNRTSYINADHLLYFAFVGRIIGKAIYDGRLLDCYFTRSMYKHILRQPVDFKDLEAVDPEFFKSLEWIIANDITDVMELNFAVEDEEFGEHRIIDLVENGKDIAVTEENKLEYVRLVTEYKLSTAIRPQIDSFLRGFNEIIPAPAISIFNERELELLISGMPEIDVDEWKNNCEYTGYTVSSAQIQWFWRAVRSFDQEHRAKLFQFVTGTSKVPLDGMASLQGTNGTQKFQIHRDYGPKDRLPSAHTCFNQLDLPEYESYEILRDQLIKAFTECTTGFGLV